MNAEEKELAEVGVERWQPILQFNGDYEISNKGRVRSWKHKSGRRRTPFMMKLSPTGNGYLQAHFWQDNKHIAKSVHRLVLEHFIGDQPTLIHETAHNNGIKTENKVENLRWATRKENNQDRKKHGTYPFGEKNSFSKLTTEDVKKIRFIYKNNIITYKQLGRIYQVSRYAIFDIVRRRTWKHLK